mmetsp:Transcript_15864/g.23030  ORF Transcript_15864/g.23030 Transcript_15864/m.23030 type:complete len:232 (-) Transcript_15864:148-843(-)
MSSSTFPQIEPNTDTPGVGLELGPSDKEGELLGSNGSGVKGVEGVDGAWETNLLLIKLFPVLFSAIGITLVVIELSFTPSMSDTSIKEGLFISSTKYIPMGKSTKRYAPIVSVIVIPTITPNRSFREMTTPDIGKSGELSSSMSSSTFPEIEPKNLGGGGAKSSISVGLLEIDGLEDGTPDGLAEAKSDGCALGLDEGTVLKTLDGEPLGLTEGIADTEGSNVGLPGKTLG